MVIHFHALTNIQRPGLDVWHKDRPLGNHLARVRGTALEGKPGWWRFDVDLPRPIPLDFKLIEWNEAGSAVERWESDLFQHSLTVIPGAELPPEIWFTEGSTRLLYQDPFAANRTPRVRIHLITAQKYRRGKLFIWTPLAAGKEYSLQDTTDEDGWPYFDLDLLENFQTIFNFKFITPDGTYEEDYANRTWSVSDGAEIWTHSDGMAVLSARPQKKQLTVNFRHQWDPQTKVWMHIWQDSSDYRKTIEAATSAGNEWQQFINSQIYTGIPYGIMFTSNPGNDSNAWEDNAARRFITLTDNAEYWTLEGDPALFNAMPQPTQPIAVTIVNRDPRLPWHEPEQLEIRLNKARAAFTQPRYEKQPDGTWLFWTYPQVITSFRFGSNGQFEYEYHRIKSPETAGSSAPLKTHVVLGRYPCLNSPVPADMFQDPPYLISRPGVVEEAGYLRFALHTPWCARVRVKGDWQREGAQPLELHSTLDGAYWWGQLSVDEVRNNLPSEYNGDYHGARYQFILNDPEADPANNILNGAKIVQDPAAAWVETSAPFGNSKLVNQHRYVWQSVGWQTPGPEYLMVYQIHPSRLSKRQNDLTPLKQVTREIEDGYLKDLGITALLLMPVTEKSDSYGWGYNPSYYYAVEQAYGEPDDLKKLVDTCHQRGIAVLLDVVFNHVGCDHNILWEVARDSFGRGDTQWGMMPDFTHPQVRHFFDQNLIYWRQEFHIDGFRFDHTKTIIENANPYFFSIRKPGPGGGWEFLNELRHTVKSLDPQCLFMAEQLPNDWALTNYGGSMDTQWGDNFHDRSVDMCKGFSDKASEYADALKLTHTSCQQWYNITEYSESHDEVGNVNDRIANVGGYRKGLRRNKVAAATTILSRGIPMFFMGEEAGEAKQFLFGSPEPLNLDLYLNDPNHQRVRDWWKALIELRKHNNSIQGPSPVDVHYVENSILAFSRGEGKDYYVVVNFGDGPTTRNLGQMNLPDGNYRELWNSTWPAFQVEFEDEHANGGRDAWLNRGSQLQIPDYGAVVLERR